LPINKRALDAGNEGGNPEPGKYLKKDLTEIFGCAKFTHRNNKLNVGKHIL
jgi:hypothetical protein